VAHFRNIQVMRKIHAVFGGLGNNDIWDCLPNVRFSYYSMFGTLLNFYTL